MYARSTLEEAELQPSHRLTIAGSSVLLGIFEAMVLKSSVTALATLRSASVANVMPFAIVAASSGPQKDGIALTKADTTRSVAFKIGRVKGVLERCRRKSTYRVLLPGFLIKQQGRSRL